MKKIFLRDGVSGSEGEGAEVNRLFPIQNFMNFDPFVLWDDFTVPPSAGFPDHPHRGFEGVTYIFEGSMQHKDNLGNESTVQPGGLQRFTAGKGMIHSEMPSPGSTTRGIQLWVNLPKSLKQENPAYQQVNADAVPVRDISGGTVRELAGQNSPLQLKTPVRYLDVQLEAGGQLLEEMPDEFRGFVYMIEGTANVNGNSLSRGSALFYDGDATVDVSTDESCRFMVCFGQPHDEPIHQHGPYVD
jgi:hypothetical protein